MVDVGSGTGEPDQTAALLGRSRELAALTEALQPAVSQLALARVIGQPGSGKTTLVSALARSMGPRRVLTISLTEDEQAYTWAGLAVLMADVGSDLTGLADHHRQALLVATGAGVEGTVERSEVAFAVDALIELIATSEPVLLVVDDFQWLDQATASALMLSLRRRRHTPLAVVIAHRDGPLPVEIHRLAETIEMRDIDLTGLDAASIRTVLRQHFGVTLSRAELARFLEVTGGNPLHVRELGRLVAERGGFVENEAPSSAIAAISSRVARLSASARETVAVAAIAEPAPLAVLEAVLGRDVGDDVNELDGAGLARLANGVVQFGHPLHRAAVVQLLGEAERLSLHRTLVDHFDDLDVKAFHRAQSVDGPDAEVAADVAAAADRAASRGDTDAAARLRLRAVQLTPLHHPERYARLMDAANVAADINDPGTTTELAREALHLAETEEDRTLSAVLLAVGLAHSGRFDDALTEVRVTLDRTVAPPLRVRLLEYQVRIAMFSSLTLAARLAEQLLTEAAIVGGDAHDLARTATAVLRLFTGQTVNVEELLPLAATANPDGQARLCANLAEIFCFLDMHDEANAMEAKILDHALARGDDMAAALARSVLAGVSLRSGRWRESELHCLSCIETAQNGDGDADAIDEVADMARLCAMQGRLAEADEWMARTRRGLHRQVEVNLIVASVAAGMVAQTKGDFGTAVVEYTDAAERADRAGFVDDRMLPFRADLVECLVANGDIEEAARRAQLLVDRAATLPDPRPRADAAWAHGMVLAALGDLDAAEKAFAAALEQWEKIDVPLSRARTLLAAGSLDRRIGHRSAARARLQEALRLFRDLGALPWIPRVEEELARLGDRRSTDGEQLTPTEQQVAALVAEGRTNAQVAAALFMSPKTVEHHLTRVFRKLGVRTRTQLAAQLGAER